MTSNFTAAVGYYMIHNNNMTNCFIDKQCIFVHFYHKNHWIMLLNFTALEKIFNYEII